MIKAIRFLWKKSLTVSSIIFLVLLASCKSVPPAEVIRQGDKVLIEDRIRRYTCEIRGGQKQELYLIYGFKSLYGGRADVLIWPYEQAKKLKEKYGDISSCTCKTACGRQYRQELKSLAFFTVDTKLKEVFRKLQHIKGISLVKVNYHELKIIEGVKKTWKGEIKYRKVTQPYPYYLINTIEILEEDFSFEEDFNRGRPHP
jgi:hypothetical protein